MASIKISALGELVLDRLSDTDNLIINDENTTTQRVTYKTIREGLDRDARHFTGPVEFGNTVVFNGPLAGRNVYTKDETLFEINAAVAPVEAKVLASETDIENLRMLAGIDRVSGIIPQKYIGGTFKSAVVPQFAAGPLDIVQAVNAIGAHLEVVAGNLTSLAADITANGVSINANTVAIAALDARVELLEDAVFSAAGNADGIAANGTLIDGNKTNISLLADTVGVGVGDANLGAFSGTPFVLVPNASVKASLEVLDTNLRLDDARLTATIGNLQNTDNSVVANAARLQTLIDTIVSVGTTLADGATGKEYASALNTAIANALS